MSDATPPENRTDGRRRRRWPWFAAGFLAVFVGMALTVNMYPLHRSGQSVERCKLWEYYVIEIRRAWGASGAMGPADGSGPAAITTAVQHLALSAVGGVVMLGIGWLVRRGR